MKRPMSIGLRNELRERIRKAADAEKRSMSSFVEILIEEGLERRTKNDSSQNAHKQAA